MCRSRFGTSTLASHSPVVQASSANFGFLSRYDPLLVRLGRSVRSRTPRVEVGPIHTHRKDRMRRAVCSALAGTLVLGAAEIALAQTQPAVSFPLPTSGLFGKFRGAVGDPPYVLQVAAESPGSVRLTWKVDELASDNPGDQGNQSLVFLAPGGERFEYAAQQTRREPQRSQEGRVFAVEEDYVAEIPADEYRRLTQAAQLEMQIRGKTFKLGDKEIANFRRVAPHLGSTPPAPAASTPQSRAPAASSGALTPAQMRQILEHLESEARAEPRIAKAPMPLPLQSPVWDITAGVAGSTSFAVAAQLDVYREGSEPPVTPSRPYVTVGDTVSVFIREPAVALRLPVTARVYGEPGNNAYCSVLLEPSGWAYFLPADPRLIPREDDRGILAVALPVPFRSAKPLLPTPAATKARLAALHYRDYLAARDSLKRSGMTEDQLFGLHQPAELTDMLWPGALGTWDTPEGQLSFLSESLRDDPSDHGGDSYGTYIIRSDGTVVYRSRGGGYSLVATADLDGDGTLELILSEGIAYQKNGKWIFPKGRESVYCD